MLRAARCLRISSEVHVLESVNGIHSTYLTGLKSSGGLLDSSVSFGSWTSKEYPFKQPQKRARIGGKWMQNSLAQNKPTFRDMNRKPSGRFGPPTGERKSLPRQSFQVSLPDGKVVIRYGSRFPRPSAQRVRSVMMAQQAEVGEDGAPAVVKQNIWEEQALSHNTGVQLLFLGTGCGHPAEQRRGASLAMKLSRSTWLFDCGEDTQRQVHKQPLIRQGKMDRIFITNRRMSNLLGLPGMLCTMSAARGVGLDLADMPLHLYGPPGLADYIRPLLQLSDTYIAMPVIVHEFVEHAVGQEQMQQPECLDRRSCLYRVLLPPDRLNPAGFYDGQIVPFLSRSGIPTKELAKGVDERVNVRELPLPAPGNRDARIEGMHQLRWTVKCERDQLLTAARVPASIPSYAFVCQEASRTGRLFPELCERHNVMPGKDFARLKDGRSVRNRAGQLVRPEQVIGPDIPGRKLVVVGESSHSFPLQELAHDADVVIHSASCEEVSSAGPTETRDVVEMAANFGKAAAARHLVLYKFRPDDAATGPSAEEPGSQGLRPKPGPGEGSLNWKGRLRYERREASGGYLLRPPNFRDVPQFSAEAIRSVREVAASCFGSRSGVTIAADLDLFAVERRQVPRMEHEQPPLKAQLL